MSEPSSTSNFDLAPDRGDLLPPIGRALCVVIALFCLLLVASEAYLRAKGVRTSVRDDPELWAIERRRIAHEPNALVLLGTSRMQLDVLPNVLKEELGAPSVVNLSIAGYNPISSAIDLANEPSFRGTVVLEISPATPFVLRSIEPLVDYARTGSTVSGRFNREIARRFEGRFRVLSAATNFQTVTFREKSPCEEGVDPDRSGWMYCSRVIPVDPVAVKRTWDEVRTTARAEKFAEIIASLAPFARQLQARGGRFVIVNMPLSQLLYDAMASALPRAEYWDRVAELSSAPTVTFEDYPSLNGFYMPDGRHLHFDQRERFTRALAAILRDKLPPPTSNSSRDTTSK